MSEQFEDWLEKVAAPECLNDVLVELFLPNPNGGVFVFEADGGIDEFDDYQFEDAIDCAEKVYGDLCKALRAETS